MKETVEVAIIGAGIVGLAVGLEVLRRRSGCRLLILEKESAVAFHQTGHNSGVIHSGIYYKPGSLKARLCVTGAAAMLEFVKAHNIPYLKCGKVIVATEPAQLPALKELSRRGAANGVPGLRWLPDRAAIRDIEPYAAGLCGIHVASTAITDFKQVAEQYSRLIIQLGGNLLFNAEVNLMTRTKDGETLLCTSSGDFRARYIINCAGLHSDRIARMAGARLDTTILPFRGEYYELLPEKHYLVRGLIYPVPDPNFPFLGVHFTRRILGGIEAGPNAVLALKREGYKKTSFSFPDSLSILRSTGFWKIAFRYWRAGIGEMYRSWSKAAFTRNLQKLVPELQGKDLATGGAGVRAQAVDQDGKLIDDFRFVHSEGITHVTNVPSPAATASLKIAEVIVNHVADRIVR